MKLFLFTLSFTLLSIGLQAQAGDVGVSVYLEPENPPNSTALIQITLRNFGSDTLQNVDINTVINGIPKQPYKYIGPPLAPNKKIDLYISAHRFNANATYFMEFYTSNPNGRMDSNTSNDTLKITLKGELDLEANDAGITNILQPSVISQGYKLVRVRLKNFGIDPIENVTIGWRVNGVEQTPYNYVRPTLRSRREIDLFIGGFRFKEGEPYTISARTIMPNGIEDDKPNNNRVAREY